MFIQASSSFVLPVDIEYLKEDGSTETRTLKCKFKRLSQTEIDNLFDRINRGQINDAKVIEEVFQGWTPDTKDVNGNALEYNPENHDKVLDVHPTRPSIVRTFLNAIQGIKTKNL